MAENNIPNFVLPEHTGIFKFVQIYLKDGPYLRYLELEETNNAIRITHSRVLEEALKEFGIIPVLRKAGITRMIPSESGEGYKLAGAGKMHFKENGDCILYDNSVDYDLQPNVQHLQALKLNLQEETKLRIDYTY